MKLRFELTCGACPEQYDVYDEDNKQVAYIRLRWGNLRVDYPDYMGTTIYYHEFEDPWIGCFDSEEQRDKYLTEIEAVILKKIATECDGSTTGS